MMVGDFLLFWLKNGVILALCQILLMGYFRRRPVLAPGAAFFQLPFPFDAIGSGR